MSAPQSSGINPPTVEPIKIPSQIVDRMGADTRPRTGPRAKAARGALQNGRLAKKARHSRRAPSLGRNAVVRRHHNLRPIRFPEAVPQFTQWRPKFVGRSDEADAVPSNWCRWGHRGQTEATNADFDATMRTSSAQHVRGGGVIIQKITRPASYARWISRSDF
jgi:hypothetical protein